MESVLTILFSFCSGAGVAVLIVKDLRRAEDRRIAEDYDRTLDDLNRDYDLTMRRVEGRLLADLAYRENIRLEEMKGETIPD